MSKCNFEIRKPTLNDLGMLKNFVNSMRNEFLDFEKFLNPNSEVDWSKFKIYGGHAIEKFSAMGEWLDYLNREENSENMIKTSTYICVDTVHNEIVGIVEILHNFVFGLRIYGSNVSLSVVKERRREGIATMLMNFATLKCKEIGLDKVVVSFIDYNLAFKELIERLNFEFVDRIEVYEQILKKSQLLI